MTARAKAEPQGFTINANTVVGLFSTLIGGVVLYMVTTGMGQVKTTATDVKEVKTVIPFVQESIKDLKSDVKQIQTEQIKVREDLMRQQVHP